MKLTLATALKLIEAVDARAASEDKWATVAVVDAGGHLVALHRADEATLNHTTVAIAKAYSAAIGNRSTEEAGGGPERAEFRAEMRNLDPKRTFLRGGFPIHLDGELAGGLGVSGPNGDFDVACGRAALAALERS